MLFSHSKFGAMQFNSLYNIHIYCNKTKHKYRYTNMVTKFIVESIQAYTST